MTGSLPMNVEMAVDAIYCAIQDCEAEAGAHRLSTSLFDQAYALINLAEDELKVQHAHQLKDAS